MAGRYPIYKTAKEMEKLIDKYFESCEGHPIIDDDTGKPILDKHDNVIIIGAHPPTVTGLALALGLKSRQALINYQGRDETFNDAIARAKQKCEEYAEARLYDRDGANGAKFTLANNFGWSDKKDLTVSGPEGKPLEIATLTESELQDRIAKLNAKLQETPEDDSPKE